jgi:hypothetical protein
MKRATINRVTVALIIGGIVMTGLVYWLIEAPTSRPFMLVEHRGKTATEHDYLGKPMLVFLGTRSVPMYARLHFTNCRTDAKSWA